jgi:hypothetical protein
MSIRHKLLAIAAVSALTAATAVPAMALENEFHGMMAVRGYNSNYLSGTAGRIDPTTDTATTKNWIEQRARIFYSAKVNDDLKMVTAFELDSVWGNSSYTTGRNLGGALGSDTTNIETKWSYLDFNCPITGTNFKVGIQGLNDGYKGLVFGLGADAAGLLASKAVGPFKGTFGWFRLDDRNTAVATPTATASVAGKTMRDLWIVAGDLNVTKDVKVGASYYFLNNDGATFVGAIPAGTGTINSAVTTTAGIAYDVHILGANAAANLGIASLDAFALYEFGNVGNKHLNAFAGNAAAKIKVGPGAIKANALYVSGNSSTSFGGNSFISVNNTTSGVYAENGVNALGNIWLLVRNPKETTNEQAIIAESGNQNQGIIGGSVGFDLAVGKVFANANIGAGFTAKKANNRNTYMGTEINGEVGYKLYDNLSALVRAAYVVLGDYYNNKGVHETDPANPYEAQVVLSYNF